MKKNIFIIIIQFVIGNGAFAQTGRLDSLQQALVSTENNSIRAKIMMALGEFYKYSKPDSTVYYLHIALKAAPNDTLRVKVMEYLCDFYRYRKPDSTLYYGNMALKLSRVNHFIQSKQDVMFSIIMTELAIGNVSNALLLALQAKKEAEKNNLSQSVVNNMALLGMAYLQSGLYEKALVNFKETLNFNKSNNASALVTINLAYIAETFSLLNQPDSVNEYCRLSEQYLPENSIITWFIYDKLGRSFANIGNPEKSLTYYRISIQSPEYYLRFTGNLAIAEIFQKRQDRDSAIYYGMKAFNIAKETGFYSSIIDASSFLSRMYAHDDPLKSLEFAGDALAYKDSLTNMERSMNIVDLLDMDEQQRQYELSVAQKDFQSRLKLNALLGSSFTLFVVAFVLFRSRRQKQKAKKYIEEAYDQLKSTQSQLIQSEKMASLGELTAGIAHEIQNPLNFVNNFSEVNSELVEELMEEIKKGDMEEAQVIVKDILENEQKIKHHGQRASVIVKGMLEHSRASDGKKELTDINALADEYLRLAYHGLRAKYKSFNADFKTDFDITLPKINVIQQDIGRALVNLINNAFYAVDKKAKQGINDFKPEVIVSTKKIDNKVEIRVKDNGDGIPDNVIEKIFQPFFTTKSTGQGTGLGLSLSYDIIKVHGGELKVDTQFGRYTEFTMLLPQ